MTSSANMGGRGKEGGGQQEAVPINEGKEKKPGTRGQREAKNLYTTLTRKRG